MILLPFFIFVFALLGLYNHRIHEQRFSEIGRLFTGTFIGILFLISYSYVFNQPIFPARLVAFYGLGPIFWRWCCLEQSPAAFGASCLNLILA